MASNVLEEICLKKKEHIQEQKQKNSEQALITAAKENDPTRGFHQALRTQSQQQKTGLIAEIKKASPSQGIIRHDFDVPTIATAYDNAGATCLSVLTDTPYFKGEDPFLQQARQTVSLPVLRKDFMLEPYQIIESRAIGADCILIIMAALEDNQAQELVATAQEYGMDALIEVHDREELDRALQLPSNLIGINNRNLRTLEVSLSVCEALVSFIPETHTLVCESGIRTHNDVERMQNSGIYCFLVGESLMRQADINAATKELLQ